MFEDKRCTIKPVVGTFVLLKNYLVSREPIYGVSEWARQYVPGLLGLSTSQLSSLNDDCVGRCLDQLFNRQVNRQENRYSSTPQQEPIDWS